MAPTFHQAGCCCPAVGVDCQYCEGSTTPLQFRVTFSGVTPCPDCYPTPIPDPAQSVEWVVEPPTMGSFVLTQYTSCRFLLYEEEQYEASWKFYADETDCTGDSTTYDLDGWFIELDITTILPSGNTIIRVVGTWNSGGGSFHDAVFFKGGTETETPCDETTVIDNDLDCADDPLTGTGAWVNSASGGTCTVVRI